MNRQTAHAVLTFQAKLLKACDQLEKKLTASDLQYAQAYYLAHIRSYARGHVYGSLPIQEAIKALPVPEGHL